MDHPKKTVGSPQWNGHLVPILHEVCKTKKLNL